MEDKLLCFPFSIAAAELNIMSSQDLTAMESQNQSCNDQPAMHLNSMKRSWSTDSFSINPSGKACVCSPTKHAGSFRCRLHRVSFNQQHAPPAPPAPHAKPSGSLEVVEAKWIALLTENSTMCSLFVKLKSAHYIYIERRNMSHEYVSLSDIVGLFFL